MKDVVDVLAGAGAETEVAIGDRVVRITSLDRVLWRATGTTKRDLLIYYTSVAPQLLPWIRARPLTLLRCPEGVERYGWYQTMCPHPPPWLRTYATYAAAGAEATRDYCVIDDLAGLLWAGNLSTIELHRLQSTVDDIDAPTDLVFDLDPGDDAGLPQCAAVALEVRSALAARGRSALAVFSGSRGLHVYSPVMGKASYADTKATARDLAASLTERLPELVTDHPRHEQRAGRVFIDWSQNDVNRSLIAPYSLRARNSPVPARPLEWSEVEDLVGSTSR